MAKTIISSLFILTTIMLFHSFADLSTGLVGHWKFDEGSGITVFDSSGNGYDGTIYGYRDTGSVGDSIWQDGKSGTGLRWKYGDENFKYWRIKVPYTSSLRIPLERTLSGWVYYSSHPWGDWTGHQILAMRHHYDGCFAEGNVYGLSVRTTAGAGGDKLKATFSSTCGHTLTSTNCSMISEGNWHHIAATHSIDSVARIYIDGMLVGEDTIAAYGGTAEFDLWLGLLGSKENFGFNGDVTIDEIRLYNRALSQSEINVLAEVDTTAGRRTDSLALIALYDSTGGDSWTNHTNWKTCEPIDTWYGVNVINDRVVRLSLDSNNLAGSIPHEIGKLTELSNLYFEFNNISGSIPDEIGNLTKLIYLRMFDNQLEDSIPSSIGNLLLLKELSLYRNNMEGPIPSSLGNCVDLQLLLLCNNSFSGQLPSSLSNLIELTTLWLHYNDFVDSIPSWIGDLESLLYLRMHQNGFYGSIPASIGNLPLIYIDLSFNQLSGTIPTEFGDLTSLEEIHLYNNQLEGAFPTSFGNLVNVKKIFINNNLLTSIPSEFENLTKLSIFYVYTNKIESLGDSLVNLTNLNYLNILGNKLCNVSPELTTWLDNLQPIWNNSQTCP